MLLESGVVWPITEMFYRGPYVILHPSLSRSLRWGFIVDSGMLSGGRDSVGPITCLFS